MDKSNPARILIVDDEAVMLDALTRKLTRARYDVVVALDGQEGWDRALEWRPDMVVTDYHMPVMDGLELCRRLGQHAATRNVPVLPFSSRWRDIEEKFLALDNVVGFVRKPFRLKDLVDRVASVLAQRDASQGKAMRPALIERECER